MIMDKNFLSLKDFELSMREDALTRAELFQNYIHQMEQFDSKSYWVMSHGCVGAKMSLTETNTLFDSYIFSKKEIRNSQSNMQTSSISSQNRTRIQSLQIRRDGTCVKKYFSLLAQGYTWASTSIQGFG